jgi:hypothetical protein
MLALFFGGCGLSEYETKMQEAQARAERSSQEDRYLDEPLDIPIRFEEKPGPPGAPGGAVKVPVSLANAFFRPPKGIEKKSDNTSRQGGLYVYPARKSGAAPFVQLGLAFDPDHDRLNNEVKGALPTAGDWTYKRIELRTEGGDTLYYDRFENNDDQYSYSLYVYRNAPPKPPAGWTQIAVLFWITKGKLESARKAMELSLGTLVVGPQADKARVAYRKGPWGLDPTGSR